MDAKEVIQTLQGWYGPQEGLRVYTVIMPGILKDFDRMLRENPGKSVKEEYRLEDGKGSLILTGKLEKDGTKEVSFHCQR